MPHLQIIKNNRNNKNLQILEKKLEELEQARTDRTEQAKRLKPIPNDAWWNFFNIFDIGPGINTQTFRQK